MTARSGLNPLLLAEDMTRQLYARAQTWWQDHSPAGRRAAHARAHTEKVLDDFARGANLARFEGAVLVDGSWDNPNYWLRYSLLRAALGLVHGREIGMLGEFRRRPVRGTFERLGFSAVESLASPSVSADAKRQAEALLARTQRAEDILEWKLPDGLDPAIVYDGILKRMRLAAIDVRHPRFVPLVYEAMEAIEQSRRLLDKHRFDLVVVSHPFNFTLGSLAWQALVRGIAVVLPYGLFGTLRYTRFQEPRDLFRFYDRPSGAEMDALAPDKAEALVAVGRAYMARRLKGEAMDFPSRFAFGRHRSGVDRRALCERFGWDPDKPVVGFYAANWFDWPHQLGMSQFRDFLDWTEATMDAARGNQRCNWVFKSHPAETWFGGVSLAEIFARLGAPSHVALADKTWDNSQLMGLLDSLITYHGTAGVEFAALGKPVLVPDRGKYGDCGFVKMATSRQEYLDLLDREWWRDMDLDDCRRRAEMFAGWWCCAPDWQEGFILGEDADQAELYDSIPRLLAGNSRIVARELDEILAWWRSGRLYYHTSKMARADSFRLVNVKRDEPQETATAGQ